MGVKGGGVDYDTQDFANGLYLRMRVRVGLLNDGKLCYLYMR